MLLISADLKISGKRCNKKRKPSPASLLAPTRGFEPPTYRLGGGRSILLSYVGIY